MAKETILIVDDEEDILELIKYNLTHEGYVILTAKTGEEAIKIATRSQPDLIVLDLMLPGMDGLEVTRYLRSQASAHELPIVILTAKGEESDIITGLELGANDGLRGMSLKVMQKNLSAIIKQAQKSGAQVLLLSMRIPSNYGRRYTDMFYDSYQKVASKHNISVVPFIQEDVAMGDCVFAGWYGVDDVTSTRPGVPGLVVCLAAGG